MADRPASSDGGADMALLGACRKGDLRRVEELWPRAKFPRETFKSISSLEAKPNEEFDYFENVLHAACAEGRTDVVKYLVEKQHMFVDKPDSLGRTPLLIASEGGHTAIATLTGIGCLGIVNMTDCDGQAPFHAACATGNVELIELLHRNGANMNGAAEKWIRSDDGCWCKCKLTPFAAAVLLGSKAAVDCLLKLLGVDYKTTVRCLTCKPGFELDNCDLNFLSPLEHLEMSHPKRQRRITPVKERAAKIGIALPPTPTGLRDRVADGDVVIEDLVHARKELQRHQKSCQQRVDRAEMQQAKGSATYQRFRARSSLCNEKSRRMKKKHKTSA